MRGQIPKDPALLQRRNRQSTRAVLTAEDDPEREIPELPTNRRWHKLTRAWWQDVWHSPMAAEYLQADIHGLFILALLVDRFWKRPAIDLAVEIRQQRQAFGLTPIDRRRLQWEVEKVKAVGRKMQPAPPAVADDPRAVLRVLG